jgi:hypothetical protein
VRSLWTGNRLIGKVAMSEKRACSSFRITDYTSANRVDSDGTLLDKTSILNLVSPALQREPQNAGEKQSKEPQRPLRIVPASRAGSRHSDFLTVIMFWLGVVS